MRILLIGDFSGKGDEGFTQLSKKVLNLLKKKNEVINFNTRDVVKPNVLNKIIKFNPEIIHYFTGITIKSFIILLLLKIILLRKPKTVLSAIRVFLKPVHIKLLPFFKPDLILTQAKKWEIIFNNAKIKTIFLQNFVDTNKFQARKISISKLRRKYNLPLNKKIMLHVGHIRHNRNLTFLIENYNLIQQMDYDLLIVGSTFHQTDSKLLEKMLSLGIFVINEFIHNINEIYLLSDIYVFPVKGLCKNYFPKDSNEVGVIDMPLSIIEALSCGLPVVSPPIDSLEYFMEKFGKLNIEFYDPKVPATFEEAVRKFNNRKRRFLRPDFFGEKFFIEKLNKIYNTL